VFPSACRARRSGSCRRRIVIGGSVYSFCRAQPRQPRRRSAPHAGLGRRPATSSRSACVVGPGRSAPPASLR
jgi:hypothetical protein